MELYSATILLWLVMDPLGNIPGFLAVLNSVDPRRHVAIILRESLFAFAILTFFLFAGESFLNSLQLSQAALDIAGGIILFLIAIRMIFPESDSSSRERYSGEPFFVPLAIPFIAGPSALATVMVFASQSPQHIWYLFGALTIASILSTVTLLFGNALKNLLGQKGLIALERLMGMILTTIAVQMLLTGIDLYFHLTK